MEILICASLQYSVETAPFRLYPFYAYYTGLIWHVTSFTQVHGDSHIHIHLRKTDAVIALNACTNTLTLFCYLCNYVYCRVGKQYLDLIYKKKEKKIVISVNHYGAQLVQTIFRKVFPNMRWKKSNRSTWKALLEAVRLRWNNKKYVYVAAKWSLPKIAESTGRFEKRKWGKPSIVLSLPMTIVCRSVFSFLLSHTIYRKKKTYDGLQWYRNK